MKRFMTIPDQEQLTKIVRATTNKDVAFFFEKVKAANVSINASLRQANSEVEIYRLQGAGQVLDEIVEIIDKAEVWLRDLQAVEK